MKIVRMKKFYQTGQLFMLFFLKKKQIKFLKTLLDPIFITQFGSVI